MEPNAAIRCPWPLLTLLVLFAVPATEGLAGTQGGQPAETGLVRAGRNVKGFEVFIRQRDGARLVRIPSGSFRMGNPDPPFPNEKEDLFRDERPVHEVAISSFLMDETEVTWARYARFCQATGTVMPSVPQALEAPEGAPGPAKDHPVVNVAWREAAAFCDWSGGRLPTEAEWEYAARGPQSLRFPWGEDAWPIVAGEVALATRAHDGRPQVAVGESITTASPFGVQEMIGNVWEWTADWHDSAYYERSPGRNPAGPSAGTRRVVRGGGWDRENPTTCIVQKPEPPLERKLLKMLGSIQERQRAERIETVSCHWGSSLRESRPPSLRSPYLGFRCAQDRPEMAAPAPPQEEGPHAAVSQGWLRTLELQNTFGASGTVASTADGGLIVATAVGASADAGPSRDPRVGWRPCGATRYRCDLLVMKWNAEGDTEWQKIIGNRGINEVSPQVEPTRDGGCVVASVSGRSILVLKLDIKGNLEWQTLTEGGLGVCDWVREAGDGGCFLSGEWRSGESSFRSSFRWLARVSAGGKIEWARRRIPRNPTIRGMEIAPDGGLLLAGHRGEEAWVGQLDPAGALVWERTYGGAGSFWASDLHPTEDGGAMVLGGRLLSEETQDRATWIMEIDAEGNVEWVKEYEEALGDCRIGPSDKGGYLVVGHRYRSWVMELDAKGEVLRHKRYALPAAFSLFPTWSNGSGSDALMATGRIGPKTFKLWILKLGADGEAGPGCPYVLPGSAHAAEGTPTLRSRTPGAKPFRTRRFTISSRKPALSVRDLSAAPQRVCGGPGG